MRAKCIVRGAVDRGTDKSGIVLIAGDEAADRRSIRVHLERLGLTVLEATSGTEAWTLFQETRGTTTMVIAEVRMLGMSGLALALKLTRLQPDLPVILLTGTPEDLRRRRCPLPIIEKPFSWPAAEQIICQSLGFAISVQD